MNLGPAPIPRSISVFAFASPCASRLPSRRPSDPPPSEFRGVFLGGIFLGGVFLRGGFQIYFCNRRDKPHPASSLQRVLE